MKNYISYSVVLFLVVGISCGILAYVNQITKPLIEENLRKEQEHARMAVFPEATRFELIENEHMPYYKVYAQDDTHIGYTIVAIGRGYSSDIQTMVGLNLDFTIHNISIIYQNETPGLGDKYVKRDFYDLFKGKQKSDMKVNKDGGNITCITGATMTARAIVKAIGSTIEKLALTIETEVLEKEL